MQWQKEKDKTITVVYKTLHRKLKIEQHESHLKLGWNSVGDNFSP